MRDSGLKVCARVRMPKKTHGITGLHEILGWDYGIEKPYWGPSEFCDLKFPDKRSQHHVIKHKSKKSNGLE